MSTNCPKCQAFIPLEDVNVTTDVALCRTCETTHSYSGLLTSDPLSRGSVEAPEGAWFERLPDGFDAGASTRSARALFLVPFSAVWIGVSMSGLYGTQFASGTFDPARSFFGIPFLLGSVMLLSMCFMSTIGSIRVVRRSNEFEIFTGVAFVGWRRRYAWSDFETVRERTALDPRGYWGGNASNLPLVLEGKRRAVFASLLDEEKRYFLLNVLRREMTARS